MPEHEEIDAAIAMAGRDVDRRVGSTAGARVPWPAPRRDSRLERGDNPVGEFLVVVASLCGMAVEVSHSAAPRNGIVLETASPPRMATGGARARQRAGRDQRSGSTGRTLAAAGVYARSVSSPWLHGVCINLYSSF